MCNLSEHVYESGIQAGKENGADELIQAIQYMKEGTHTLKELTEKGISSIIAQNAITLGIK